MTFWLWCRVAFLAVWIGFIVWLVLTMRFESRAERRAEAAKLPQRIPRDPAGWGWMRPEEREQFEAIVSTETTGSEGQ